MSQVWSSGGYFFAFDDDGVNAHTLDGVLVSGLTTGFTPWLVEDGPQVQQVVVLPPCLTDCVPVVITNPNPPGGVVVPEPHMGLVLLGILIVFVVFMIKESKEDDK